jgi:hypothetical protein
LAEQPDPVPNDRPSLHDLLVKDILERKQLGLARYGTIIQPFNGRDQLQDCYEEQLDQLVYLKAALIERDELLRQLGELRADLARQKELNLVLAERCLVQSNALADAAGRRGGSTDAEAGEGGG